MRFGHSFCRNQNLILTDSLQSISYYYTCLRCIVKCVVKRALHIQGFLASLFAIHTFPLFFFGNRNLIKAHSLSLKYAICFPHPLSQTYVYIMNYYLTIKKTDRMVVCVCVREKESVFFGSKDMCMYIYINEIDFVFFRILLHTLFLALSISHTHMYLTAASRRRLSFVLLPAQPYHTHTLSLSLSLTHPHIYYCSINTMHVVHCVTCRFLLQGDKDSYDALSCRPFLAKEPLIIGESYYTHTHTHPLSLSLAHKYTLQQRQEDACRSCCCLHNSITHTHTHADYLSLSHTHKSMYYSSIKKMHVVHFDGCEIMLHTLSFLPFLSFFL